MPAHRKYCTDAERRAARLSVQRRYRENHKEKLSEQHRALWYENRAFRERVQRTCRRWRTANRDRYNTQARAYQGQGSKALTDNYVKRVLHQRGWQRRDITKDVLETMRAILQLKREIQCRSRT